MYYVPEERDEVKCLICGEMAKRPADHLNRFHNMKAPEYAKCKKTLIKIAKTEDTDDLYQEEIDVQNILPDKFDDIKDKNSIDISYLRPDSNQETDELLLPLPLWARQKQLNADVILQTDIDAEDIFGTPSHATVNLQFKGRKRKRKYDFLD